MSQDFSVVGKRLPRPDAVEKATGAARFGGDIKLPGMLIGKVLRSPYPHAKILKIDTSKAEKLSGVESVVTQNDVEPQRAFLSSFQNLPISPVGGGISELADETIFVDKAHFVGDPIAAVAAVSESVAEEALELIKVEYEQLPAVFDPQEAIESDAPRVHNSVQGNIPIHRFSPLSEGDVEMAFQEADLVVEDTFHNSRQFAAPIESAVTIASFDSNGRLTIWVQSQMAHIARKQLAYIFDMPEGMIRLITPYIGGSFGVRNSMSPEVICPVLAKKAGKPVKLEYTKEEDFSVYGARPGFRYNEKLGFNKDGTLTTIQVKAIADTGAYISKTTTHVAVFLGFSLEGPYRCRNKVGEVDFVYTNHLRTSAFRGMGYPMAAWGIEQLMDRAAEKLGMDPLELRLKNLKKVGDPSWAGKEFPIYSTALDECIRVGAERIGWKEKRARKEEGVTRRGVGAAIMMYLSGSQPFVIEHSSAFIKMNEDGSANLVVHPVDVGQGCWGTLAQIAAEELGLRVEDIHIVTGDTDVTLFDVGSYASRTAYVTGGAVLRAAREVKKQLLERAAKALGRSSDDELEIKDRRIYVRTAPKREISIAKVANDAIHNLNHESLHISGKGLFDPNTVSPSTQAAFAEVEVNTITGEVKILKVVIAQDCGTAINPTTVEGQLEGGLAQGIGFALYENPTFDEDTGALITDSFETYKIPSTLDMPDTELILVEKPDPVGPFGAKSVGESSMITVAPAIGNAIYNAVGVQIIELPITPEKILKAIEAKNNI